VARELLNRLELEERLVSLDALHTQDETARALVLEHGADYLLTVKGNQPTLRQQIETLVAAPRAISPLRSRRPPRRRLPLQSAEGGMRCVPK
jgi:predicted transposase YbfD/YdcC